jgi:hypothetical protein
VGGGTCTTSSKACVCERYVVLLWLALGAGRAVAARQVVGLAFGLLCKLVDTFD